MATTNAGLVMVPINVRLVGNEICYLLEDSEAARPDRPCGGHPRRSFACRDRYIHFGAAVAPKGYRSYEDLIAAASARAPKMAVAPKGHAGSHLHLGYNRQVQWRHAQPPGLRAA
jgi:hypothetical protein